MGRITDVIAAVTNAIAGIKPGDQLPLTAVVNPDGSAISGSGSMQMTDTVIKAPATYAGGTITTGGTSQQLLATNANRRGWTLQNQSTGDLYYKIGGSATLDRFSYRLAAGQFYETPPHHTSTGAVNIIGATAGQAFYATEF